ncbi:MAG: hypothetical protein V1875_06005 [Candidatus Altiarchaeota archaeon]
MVETFATSQYEEKFFGNLTLAQSLMMLALSVPGVFMAAKGFSAPIILGYGGFCVVAYARLITFGEDRRRKSFYWPVG